MTRDALFVALQFLLPKRGLSDLVGWLTRREWGTVTRLGIRLFIRAFRVDMRDAEATGLHDYATFNAFFTRALKATARPLSDEPAALVSPADGTISAAGPIEGGRVLQAKGRNYGLDDLFGGDKDLAERFVDGTFCTVYLAPYNYHRVHMPLDGRPALLRYLPGALFSVNTATAAGLDRLFCRNERVAAIFDVAGGALAMIMVGAMNVGSIELTLPAQAPFRNRPRSNFDPFENHVIDNTLLRRGDEFGRFNMGSTVIMLATSGVVTLDTNLEAGRTVRVGERLGILPHTPSSKLD